MVGLKIMVTFAKISLKIVNPRDIAGNVEKEGEYSAQTNDSSSWFCCYWLVA